MQNPSSKLFKNQHRLVLVYYLIGGSIVLCASPWAWQPQSTLILGYLFQSLDVIACLDAADVNDDAKVNIADPICILQYQFTAGADPPEAPFPYPGFDPTPDDPFVCGDAQEK